MHARAGIQETEQTLDPGNDEGEAPTYSTDLVRRQETRSSAEDQDKSLTILSRCVNIVATRLLPLEEKIGFC